MKTLTSLGLLLLLAMRLSAQSVTTSYASDQTISIPTAAYDIRFSVAWFADDYPQNSAPGRIELYSGTTLISRVVASNYRGSGASISVSGGTVDDVSSTIHRYTPSGAPADGYLYGTWHLTGLSPGNYTVRAWTYFTNDRVLHASTVWTEANFEDGWSPGPTNRAPTITWLTIPATAAHGEGYYLSAHGHDDDANLSQVNIWKNGVPFAFAGGGDGTNGDSGNATSDAGPQTITYTAQAVDASGQTSAMIAHVITIDGPPPVQFTLVTAAGLGGNVSAGGVYPAGATATIIATPDSAHDFAGWSGDAGGTNLTTSVGMDRDKTVTANFTPKLYALTTSATAGGAVTLGGSYPYGTTLTVSATPDSTHRFIGWAGDAAGAASSILLTLTGPLGVQAVFIDKTPQTIAFPSPGSQPANGVITLAGTASSGLPVAFVVVSGPAAISGSQLQITGPGAITVQARQGGDGFYLPAPSVTQTFNAVATATLKYRPAGRTVFTATATAGTAPFVLEKP